MTHDPFSATPRRPPSLAPQEPLTGRKPRLLAHVLRAFDWHQGGAERALWGILKGLQQRGWDALCVTVENRAPLPPSREWDGVPIRVLTDSQMADPYEWCDLAITHLDVTPSAMAWARYGRPLAHLVHNHRQLVHHRVPDDGRNAVIFNSEWVSRELDCKWDGPSIVCHPPSRAVDHRTTNAKRATARTATLVNLLGEKGGPLFWRLAERCPDWTFIGVEGAYGWGPTPAPMPANATYVRQSTDLRPVWKQTSVYLAPSWYESWGCAPIEAAASGIAVVAHPTPGLREAFTSSEHGECAWFIDRDDDDAWVHALTELAKPTIWRRWSKLSRLRSAELDRTTESDLDALDRFCRSLIKEPDL